MLLGKIGLELFILSASIVGSYSTVPRPIPNWYAPQGYLAPLKVKLSLLKQSQAPLSIVQIGDSHIQAGHTTAPIRRTLQRTYGNAGRGWVGWYRLYGSNAPSDYRVTSTGLGWQKQTLLKDDGAQPMGVGGYALSTRRTGMFSLSVSSPLNPFSKMYLLRTASSHTLSSFPLGQLRRGVFSVGAYVVDTLSWHSSHTEVTLSPQHGDGDEAVYAGCVLLSGKGGVLVHDIGINGTTYRNYAREDYIEQLALLEPELLIISLGTNDSYSHSFSTNDFRESLERMICLVKEALPHTKILLTTPPPSYFRQAHTTRVGRGKRRHKKTTTMSYTFNDNARRVASEIMRYAETHGIAAFDLYSAMGGEIGMAQWVKDGLIATDRVHYSVTGYERQGQLIAEAILAALGS